MSIQKKFQWALMLMLVAAVAVWSAGCDSKSSTDNDGDTGSAQISVVASPTSVETSETSVVEAIVTNGGVAVAGEEVIFTVVPSGAGTVSPSTVTTGADGVAATVFTATQTGSVVVQAQVAGTSLSTSVGLSVSAAAGSGSGNVNVSVSESLLLANGHDSSLVTIVVRDELGQPAADGTVIKLTAGEKFVDVDGNGYWSQNIDTLVFDANGNDQWDSYGLIQSTALVAGGNGTATVYYVSGDDAYTVYIKATVDDNGLTGWAEASVQLSPNAVLHSIYLASDSMTLSVQSTGGIESGQLRAIGYDVNGNPVPAGIPIVFAILDGPGGGESLDTLGNGPDTATTNGLGQASTIIHSGTVSGTIRVRAYSGTILSNATQVLVAAGPPEYIVVGTEVCNIDAWARVADSVGIVAVVSDVYLNPVNDSTVVYFYCDEGTMIATQRRTRDNKGIATSAWLSGNNVPTADGKVWVFAETSGGTVLDSVLFYNTHFAATVTVTGWQDHILADGDASFWATVHAVDLNDNPVIGGTPFTSEPNYLTVANGTFEDGCYTSMGRVKVVSTTLQHDRSLTGANDDGIGAIDYVTFRAEGGAAITMACELWTGAAYSGNSMISGPTTALPGETIQLMVTVADRWGNPLGDHTLNMTASGGVVSSASHESNEFGEAIGYQWTAPAGEGDYNITVTDTDPRGSGMILTFKVNVKAAT